MPHIKLEYSNNVVEQDHFEPLFNELHQILVKTCHAKLEACKSRAIRHTTFYIGDGNPKNGMVHLEISLLEGRSIEARIAAGSEILPVLERYFAKSQKELHLQITVEIKEMKMDLYFKT